MIPQTAARVPFGPTQTMELGAAARTLIVSGAWVDRTANITQLFGSVRLLSAESVEISPWIAPVRRNGFSTPTRAVGDGSTVPPLRAGEPISP